MKEVGKKIYPVKIGSSQRYDLGKHSVISGGEANSVHVFQKGKRKKSVKRITQEVKKGAKLIKGFLDSL